MQAFIEEKVEFEDILFNCDDSSLSKLIKFIPKIHFQQKWLQSLIFFVSSYRPFLFKQLGSIFEITGKSVIKSSRLKAFPCYLYSKQILQKDDFLEFAPPDLSTLKKIQEYENPHLYDKLAYIILEDNLSMFLVYLTICNINIEEHYIKINGWDFKIKWFVCYCGSMNILKYLLLNGTVIDRCSIVKAIQGGSEECIQFLEQKGVSFNGTLRLAVECHQNKIAKWLYDNYIDDDFKLPYCVEVYNTHMLLYFLNNFGWNINEQDSTRKTVLHWAVSRCDYMLADYLLFKGVDKTIKEWYGRMAYDYLKIRDEKKTNSFYYESKTFNAKMCLLV